MNDESRQVFRLRYVDSRVTPGDWAFSDGMTIGYFSSEALAQEALAKAKRLPGFSEDVAGFFIDTFTVGTTYFPRGFQRSEDETVISDWLDD